MKSSYFKSLALLDIYSQAALAYILIDFRND